MIRYVLKIFSLTLVFSMLLAAQARADAPDQNFFSQELTFSSSNYDQTGQGVNVGDFIAHLKPGLWSVDQDIAGAWIYRITFSDQLSGQTTNIALLFVPSNSPSGIMLSRAIVNQQEIPEDNIQKQFWSILIATKNDETAASSPAASANVTLPFRTRFGVLTIDETNSLLLNSKQFSPNVQGNNSLNLKAVIQIGDHDVAVAEDVGGTACPSLYRIIDISASGATETGEFGTCGALKIIDQKGDAIQITEHDFLGPLEAQSAQDDAYNRLVRYEYENGAVTEDGKPLKMQ